MKLARVAPAFVEMAHRIEPAMIPVWDSPTSASFAALHLDP